ncbi:hypothetical protein [Rathayibacter iranicus]|uniref:hypothetical protein n=1 Tax=Rathayibacter iranicus TaxID=59737 RepID=UPI000FDCCC71|nr:hypothetical protein [Rathayibacter iranicus]MWV32253.1 hypothetical protein [Rathayibacter iranicus NCPPB 2253 = VKM Ac-1602]
MASALSLDESDFSGDAAVAKIAAFKREVVALGASSEHWAIEWLSDEHYKAAVLYGAAKVNWDHELAGQGTSADRRMRLTIVSRFNEWVEEIQDRLNDYERSARTAADVADWRDELARFRTDPVRNR